VNTVCDIYNDTPFQSAAIGVSEVSDGLMSPYFFTGLVCRPFAL